MNLRTLLVTVGVGAIVSGCFLLGASVPRSVVRSVTVYQPIRGLSPGGKYSATLIQRGYHLTINILDDTEPPENENGNEVEDKVLTSFDFNIDDHHKTLGPNDTVVRGAKEVDDPTIELQSRLSNTGIQGRNGIWLHILKGFLLIEQNGKKAIRIELDGTF